MHIGYVRAVPSLWSKRLLLCVTHCLVYQKTRKNQQIPWSKVGINYHQHINISFSWCNIIGEKALVRRNPEDTKVLRFWDFSTDFELILRIRVLMSLEFSGLLRAEKRFLTNSFFVGSENDRITWFMPFSWVSGNFGTFRLKFQISLVTIHTRYRHPQHTCIRCL